TVFAIVDSLGFGLQQLADKNESYARDFARFGTILAALIPVARFLAGLFLGQDKPRGPPSTMSRIFRQQLLAGLMSILLLGIPLTFLSFAAHAVYQGGSALGAGLATTALAVLL